MEDCTNKIVLAWNQNQVLYLSIRESIKGPRREIQTETGCMPKNCIIQVIEIEKEMSTIEITWMGAKKGKCKHQRKI